MTPRTGMAEAAPPGADRRRAEGDLRPRLARRDRGADRHPRRRLLGARPPLFRRQGRPDPRHHAPPARRVRRRRRRPACKRADSPRARLSAIIRGSFGPEQFHHATISAWLTFYAWALSSRPGGAAPAHLPAPPAQQPRPCAASRSCRRRRPTRIAEGLGALHRRRLPARGPARPPDRARGGDRRRSRTYLDRELAGTRADARPARRLALDRRRARSRTPPARRSTVRYPATGEAIATLHEATPAAHRARRSDGAGDGLRRLVGDRRPPRAAASCAAPPT